MIKASGLPAVVKERSIRVFTELGEAEAKTHGSTLDQVDTWLEIAKCTEWLFQGFYYVLKYSGILNVAMLHLQGP